VLPGRIHTFLPAAMVGRRNSPMRWPSWPARAVSYITGSKLRVDGGMIQGL